tara:strand:+ start:374 stop:532 length:159 start_codon:yes stop_codon:yes gene_type:complete
LHQKRARAVDNVFRKSMQVEFNIKKYLNIKNYYPRKENLTNFSRHDGAVTVD